MALSAKTRQKKLERKRKKRKRNKKSFFDSNRLGKNAYSYAKHPFHECLVPSGLFETGIGTVVATKKTPQGNIAISAFIVDVFCLGVKNTLFRVTEEGVYENTMKPGMIESHEGQEFERIHPSCAKKLILGAVDYANNLGFSPHKDYRNSIGILNDVDFNMCPVTYHYGKNGKPFYIQGPHETLSDAKKIINKLQTGCGDNNYNCSIVFDPDILNE